MGKPIKLNPKEKKIFEKLTKRLGYTEEEALWFISMKRLIPVDETDNTVSGRKLHEVLGVGSKFTDWMKRMIAYGFQENVDYTTIWSNLKNENAMEYLGSSQKMSALGYEINYILTLEMAKHIAMVQRTEVGREFRSYFIMCEEVAHKNLSWENAYNLSDALRKEMTDAYQKQYVSKYGREPKTYGTLQNSVYLICFDMKAEELKRKLEIKYTQTVPQWIEEEQERALCYTYNRIISLIEMGELDLSKIKKTTIELFDKKYGGPIDF